MIGEFFEAKIVRVNTRENTCTLRRIGDSGDGKGITDVPLPQQSGYTDRGVYIHYPKDTRVLAFFAPAITQNPVTILSVLTEAHMSGKGLDPMDLPATVYSNPRMRDSAYSPDAVMRGAAGSDIGVFRSGDIRMSTSRGNGMYLRRRGWGDSLYLTSHLVIESSNSHNFISGNVIRVFGADRLAHQPGEFYHNDIRCDFNQDNPAGLHEVGMFPASIACDTTGVLDLNRNPRRSEYVLKVNEYAEQSSFKGFDHEVLMQSGDADISTDGYTFSRDKSTTNRLHMPENQLLEVIAGSVVDINGNVLDINYNKVVLGTGIGRYPWKDKRSLEEIIAVDTMLKSRREIGYHFQLSTNVLSIPKSTSTSNFCLDIDKEGVLKLNVPSSTNTGNIPFSSTANFLGPGDDVSLKYSNPSKKEPVPVMLWSDFLETNDEDGDGEVDAGALSVAGGFRKLLLPRAKNRPVRETGVEHLNIDDNQYFPKTNDGATKDSIRINTTKYHNMYAAAERAIATRITDIKMVKHGNKSLIKSSPYGKQFEVLAVTTRNSKEQLDPFYPSDRTVVTVEPAQPAIYPGGINCVVAGSSSGNWSTYSNSYETTTDSKEGPKAVPLGHLPTGGKSANLNFEGSVEMSVGKDNFDGKSFVLDTAGALIAWLGKDRNGRSAVVQTDGEVVVNIGGSYGEPGNSNEYNSKEDAIAIGNGFNPGRLDLKVNVLDKGFVGTDGTGTDGSNPYRTGDYTISISENGLVIAGCNTGKPMVIRNDGDINIEATNMLRLYGGHSLELIDAQQKPVKISGNGANR